MTSKKDPNGEPSRQSLLEALEACFGSGRQQFRVRGGVRAVSPEVARDIVQLIAEAYQEGQAEPSLTRAEQSSLTIGVLGAAIKKGSIADYFAARESGDPQGKLAQVLAIIYAQNPFANLSEHARLMDLEATYRAQHQENLGMGN